MEFKTFAAEVRKKAKGVSDDRVKSAIADLGLSEASLNYNMVGDVIRRCQSGQIETALPFQPQDEADAGETDAPNLQSYADALQFAKEAGEALRSKELKELANVLLDIKYGEELRGIKQATAKLKELKPVVGSRMVAAYENQAIATLKASLSSIESAAATAVKEHGSLGEAPDFQAIAKTVDVAATAI